MVVSHQGSRAIALRLKPLQAVLAVYLIFTEFGSCLFEVLQASVSQAWTTGGMPQARHRARQPCEDIGQPFEDIGQPFEDIGQPCEDIGQPCEDIGQTFEDIGQPFEDIGQPFEDTGQPFEDTGCEDNIYP